MGVRFVILGTVEPIRAVVMVKPQVTIVVSPRERFSYTRQSLESIYAHTSYPFDLVYVDGNSPRHISRYLEKQAVEKGFKLIRTQGYLAPNQARNIGLKEVDTEYVLFIDNDVDVAPQWLEKLIECAKQTNADVVCPLTCIGKNLHQKIHLAGGEARIITEVKNNRIRRKVHEVHYFVNRPVAEVKDKLVRKQCEFAEFHCMLVRTEMIQQLGGLDERLLNTREHIDFCLSVAEAGGTIYCEPASVVTYVPDTPFAWSDVPFFMLRWSDAWEIESLDYFQQKWQLRKKDKYFKKRYGRLGYRRHNALLKPLLRRLFGQQPPLWLQNTMVAGDRLINRWITNYYSPKTKDVQRGTVALRPTTEH